MPITTTRLNPSWPARVALATAALLGAHTSAQAEWAGQLYVVIKDALQVGSTSGSYTWTTVREGAAGSYSTHDTLGRNFQFQTWNGSAWPEDDFVRTVDLPLGDVAGGNWLHDLATTELSSYGVAAVNGKLSNGESAGGYAVYDFTLVVAPQSSVEVQFLDGYSMWGLGHDAGDTGIAYASLSLYSTALDLDAAGGANQPYFLGLKSLEGGATDATLSGSMGLLAYTFGNATDLAQTHQLRLEASVQVYTQAVPEPQTWALWLAGLGGLGALARRRAGRA